MIQKNPNLQRKAKLPEFEHGWERLRIVRSNGAESNRIESKRTRLCRDDNTFQRSNSFSDFVCIVSESWLRSILQYAWKTSKRRRRCNQKLGSSLACGYVLSSVDYLGRRRNSSLLGLLKAQHFIFIFIWVLRIISSKLRIVSNFKVDVHQRGKKTNILVTRIRLTTHATGISRLAEPTKIQAANV